MKLYIFAVLVLLYLQSSQGSRVSSCCETELADFILKAKKFIADFKAKHDQSHDSVAAIAELCIRLFNLEYKFLSGDYSIDLNDARCQLEEYFASIVDPSTQIYNYVDSVEIDCGTLVDMAGEYATSTDLTCQDSFFLRPKLRGCDAELNALKCELAAFLKDLQVKRDNAVAFIKGIKEVLAKMGEKAANFVSSTDLTCGGDGVCNVADYCPLRIKANAFFVDFNEIHWTGHIDYVNLQYICDGITRAVSTLNVKYSCLC